MTEGTALVKRIIESPTDIAEYSEERIALIARTVAPPGTTAEELTFYLSFCQARGLNPLDRQVHLMKNKGRISIITGIDGLRLIAQRTGEWEGRLGPEWIGAPGDEWSTTPPEDTLYAARVGVWRTGFREPLWTTVLLSEFRREGENWNTRPAWMLGIRAEAHALKAAFPAETAGVTVHYEGGVQVAPTFSGDPDADLTYPQLGMLHKLAKQHGWTRSGRLNEASVRLGHIVDSFSDLTRGEAHRLIDEWTNELDEEAPREGSDGETAESTPHGDEAPRAAPVAAEQPDELTPSAPLAPAAHDVAAEGTEPASHASPTSAARNVQGKGGRSTTGKGEPASRPADTSEGDTQLDALSSSEGRPEGADSGSATTSDPTARGRPTRTEQGEQGSPENAAKVAATPSASTHRFVGTGLLCEKCHAAEEHEDHKGAK